MCPRPVVVLEVLRQNLPKMPFADHDDVVKTLASARTTSGFFDLMNHDPVPLERCAARHGPTVVLSYLFPRETTGYQGWAKEWEQLPG